MDISAYDDPQDAVGVAFRLYRRRMRQSQRELAQALGWDHAKVGRWESGNVSPALDKVDGVLRGMGFRLAVVVAHPEDWADVGEPAEHVADRGGRHLPAHLDQMVLTHVPLHWWLRYGFTVKVGSSNWSYATRARAGLRASWARGDSDAGCGGEAPGGRCTG